MSSEEERILQLLAGAKTRFIDLEDSEWYPEVIRAISEAERQMRLYIRAGEFARVVEAVTSAE